MRSLFSIAGHPIHPMLVPVAIGLFTWTFIADVVYFLSDKDPTWYDISFWTGIAAIKNRMHAPIPCFTCC